MGEIRKTHQTRILATVLGFLFIMPLLCGAAFAAEQLDKSFSTGGVVFSVMSSQRVLISLGKYDQLRKGAEIHIMQQGNLVAKGIVVKISPLCSEVQIQWMRESSRIQPGDKTIVVTQGPEIIEAKEPAKEKPKGEKEGAVLGLSILGIILIFCL